MFKCIRQYTYMPGLYVLVARVWCCVAWFVPVPISG
jgi:hypothetical protein